jgi:hypothetical protein
MHERTCDGKAKTYKKKDKTSLNVKKPLVECIKSSTGKHDLVVLRGINQIQVRAMQRGYTAYCKICKELI